MIIYTANSTGRLVQQLSELFPDRLGMLMAPGAQRSLLDHGRYALDNGRFVCWKKGAEWSERAFFGLLDWAAKQSAPPQWIVVPDVVADRDRTLREWDKWLPILQSTHWPLALAVQDGMTQGDVPNDASVVFVGGTTGWKWSHLDWPKPTHIGRVNTFARLLDAEFAGAESVDGTGWFRGDHRQTLGLIRFLVKDIEAPDRRIEAFFAAALYCLENLMRWGNRPRKSSELPLFEA